MAVQTLSRTEIKVAHLISVVDWTTVNEVKPITTEDVRGKSSERSQVGING